MFRTLSLLSLLAIPALITGCAANAQEVPAPAAAPVTYKLSGSLWAKVYKDASPLAAGLSHDHAIKATGWSGTATWDPANVAGCKVNITLPVSGLDPDEPSFRAAAGFTTTLDDGQRAEIKGHIVGSSQLNAASFPNITFASSACAANGTATNVTGTISIHGVGKSITVPMKVTADGTSFSAKGGFALNQTDFGVTPFSALLGQLKNQNRVDVILDVKGTKQ